MINIGDTIPEAALAVVGENGGENDGENDALYYESTSELFDHGRFVLVGIPGVFTPVCTNQHMTELIANAESIKAQDISQIYCISDDNPWAMNEWRKVIPSNYMITFLSDGNRDFLNATGLHNNDSELFVSSHYCRFLAIIENRVLKSLRVEDHVCNVSCTTGREDIVLEEA